MCFTSSGHSSWLVRASLAFLLAGTLARAAQAQRPNLQRGELERSWYRATQVLDHFNAEQLRERVDEVLQTADRFGLRRLTPFAVALVIRARSLDDQSRIVALRQAVRLDPGSTAARFALASALLRQRQVLAATEQLVRGSGTLLRDGRLATRLRATLVLALLPVTLIALAAWALLAIRRVGARAWHDLVETGLSIRLGPNAAVFALIVFGLPIFVAGDPVWLLLWVFALCWAYLTPLQKAIGCGALLVVMATPTLLEVAFRDLTHPPSAVLGATVAMREARYAPAVLQELSALGNTFGDDPDFYRLEGDAFRQVGLLDAAANIYREGLQIKPKDGRLELALGTIYYLESDYNAALEAFDVARSAKVDPVVSNYDLALTLAQTYHFRESEDAMNAARRAGESQLSALTGSRDQQQLIIPSFTEAEAQALLDRKDPVALLNRGILPPPLQRERTFLHPLAIAALLSLVVAVGYQLVRERTGGLAGACIKCGRPFCRRCKLASESQSYCTQCVNIFLRKDMVAIDTQVAKRRQVARHQRGRQIERRLYDLILPGSGVSFLGRPVIGAALGSCAVLAAAASCVWLPRFLSPLLLGTSLLPLQLVAWAVWATAAIVTQLVPPGRG
jgi:tetratricopeptide (TPR) repeat protein